MLSARWSRPGVQERRGDDPVQLAVRDRGRTARRRRRLAAAETRRRRDASSAMNADDVDRDQDVGRRRSPALQARVPTGFFTLVRWLAHSGQRIPTGVEVMQSGQIGRPQLEQATLVSRFGCR